MYSRNHLLFFAFSLLFIFLFLADLAWGSVAIPAKEIYSVLLGKQSSSIYTEIIVNFRLPKAITAILAGASLSVAGLMMQTLFRNPLADPYILGVSSGASLGTALVVMASGFLPFSFVGNGWALIISAIVGAALVLLIVLFVSFRVNDIVSLLIVGIMFGTIAAALVSIIQNFSNPDAIKLFLMWTFGSLSAVTWNYLQILLPVVLVGIGIAFFLQKRLDGLLLGENYARGLGIHISQTRSLIILATGLLAGGITAFTGPIAFVGVAVPHIARGIFQTSSHKILLPACMLVGAALLMICDIITQIPDYTLPVNTISALFGAPVIIWIILRRK
ncbi:MAG: iron ABC transporter permease [Paludibacteraceae bacterium]|jgi:iron complex transport system permease protein|nr:iron ABC transporter permease [Paludibacteraceae bacterium]OPZ02267.1 MAG: Hemin transport system permease protein HmuU [Bacteroidetes bacterium ADurb.BinA395]HOF98836.1 iron ABC transporter permease [Paludibacteraceae bacterium]HPL76645.1 iron ABC transporter permease [Paludibacteraceae bacterium]HQF12011.1 iron ABC transporter permease [Paludibacteraceae bacterium]